MIPIGNLSVVEPRTCSPGTLLIRNARYERNPILICGDDQATHYLELPTEQREHFVLKQMVQNLGPYVQLRDFEIFCDPSEIISPSRSDIPPGALCLINDQPCISLWRDYTSAYIGLDGKFVDEDFDNFVAFQKWVIKTKSVGEQMATVFEYLAQPRES